jgi:hypothetical protein
VGYAVDRDLNYVVKLRQHRNNAPGSAGGALDSQVVGASGGWYEFDVTSAVTGDGDYSFVLKGDVNATTRDFRSSEWSSGSGAPVLRITHE